MAKYVAVGVLAVIVLAALTYESPDQGKVAQASVEEQLEGAYGGEEAQDPAPLSERVDGAAEDSAPEETVEPVEPTPAPTATEETQTTVPASSAGQFIKHTVQTGETLSDVAQAMLGARSRWREVYTYNKDRIGESPNRVRVGLTLVFPSERATVTASTPREVSAPAAGHTSGGRSYTVQRGDTLYGIARAQLGSGPRWKEIASLNQMDAAELVVGKRLRLPAK